MMKTLKDNKTMEEWARYVRKGGNLAVFGPEDVTALQDYALDIKDLKLFDHLDKFWKGV